MDRNGDTLLTRDGSRLFRGEERFWLIRLDGLRGNGQIERSLVNDRIEMHYRLYQNVEIGIARSNSIQIHAKGQTTDCLLYTSDAADEL